jgi:CRP-like cAMP-binding protein
MENIKNSIQNIYNISDVSLKKILSCLQPVRFSKKTIIIEPNRRNENIYFIEQGIARSYILVDGKEVTSWFSKEGGLVYSTNSFHGEVIGYENENVQILEDSLLYYMPISDLEYLCANDADISNWLRILYQNSFVEMERRLIYRLYMSAEERYAEFAKVNQDLFQRVNLSYIASYLGMSNVTLWSLRKHELFH